MPVIYQRLTERTLATGVTKDDLIHIVITGDTSQDPDGSSYKAKISQVFDSISGYCFTDLYASNIHSCSPLNINPLDEGDVYFGSESGVTLNLNGSFSRVGINNDLPAATLDIVGKFGGNRMLVQTQGVGSVANTNDFSLFNPTNTSSNYFGFNRYGGTILSPSDFADGESPTISKFVGNVYKGGILNPSTQITMGAKNLAPLTYNGYISFATTNGSILNERMLIDYTGNVGINTDSPSEKLHVSGNTKIDGGLTANTISATTYQNLPTDVRVTGATYSNNTFTYTNNTGGTFNVLFNTVTGLTVNGNLTVTGNTSVKSTTASTLNISTTPTTDTGTTANYLTRDGVTGEIKVKTIPGPTVYGLFSQTGTSVAVSATTVETTLISGGVGSIIIPANGFSVGDSFHGVLIGHLSCVGTATLHIRIKTVSGILLAETGVMAMEASTNKHWKLDVNFTVRQVGVATVASIASGGLFAYTKNSGLNFEGVNFSLVENTTFNTTISNTLVVTAEWNTNNAGNSIYSEIFTLNKIY